MKHHYLLRLTLIAAAIVAVFYSSKYVQSRLAKTDAATLTIPAGPVGQAYSWTLIFQDDFTASTVDTTKWAPCLYWGITSKGCYENLSNAEWYLPANRSLSNGILTLQARKAKTTVTLPDGSRKTFNYTSGFINSDRDTNTTAIPPKFDFTYGYAEIRAKVPAGKGLWPAFWMLPSDHTASNEIDIMEILGDHPEKSYMTYHYNNGLSADGSWSITGTDFSKDFHTYSVDWSPEAMVWYIDGIERYRVTDTSIIPAKAMYLLANLQVGTSKTWPGAPDTNTVFPANYDIDYIRVWKKGTALPTPTPTATPTSAPITNLLVNPSFESGTTGWSLDVKTGAAATLAVDATTKIDGLNSAVVNTTQSSTTDWYVQFAQSALPTTLNKNYTISFMAKAETPRAIAVILQKNDSPYTEYTHQTVNLTTTWTNYTLTFTSPVTESNNKLSFSLASNTGKVWLDQVVFGY